MTTIELAGKVGAGKSTAARCLESELRALGYRVVDLREGLDAAIDRTVLGSIIGVLARSRSIRARAAVSRFAVQPALAAALVVRRPGLVWSAVRAVGRSPLPMWHRRIILLGFLRPAARLPFVRRRLFDGEVLVLDEGLAHRAVNLFAWTAGPIDRATIEQHLAKVPRPDLFVLVDAPDDVCLDRAHGRGLPMRLRGRDDATVERFLSNAAEVIRIVAATMADDDARAIVIDNAADGEAHVLAHVRAGLRAAGLCGVPPHDIAVATGTTPICDVTRRPIAPRRFPTRRGAPGGPTLPDEVVDAVLAELGLARIGPQRPVPGQSRADNAFVETDDGPKVVKRYKSTIERSTVEHEHLVLRHLETEGFPAPRLAVGPGRGTSIEIDGRFHAVFDEARGYLQFHEHVWRPADRRRFVELSGRTLAALHRGLAEMQPSLTHPLGFVDGHGPRVRHLDWYLDELRAAEAQVADRPSGDGVSSLWDDLRPIQDDVEGQLRRLDDELRRAELPRQVIHGDYGPYNLLFKPGAPVMVLDFEMARLDWRIVDLAKALQQFAITRFGLDPRRLDQFVAAYRGATTLEPTELRMLGSVWRFLHLRRVVVCWTRYGRTGGSAWLDESRRKLQLADIPIDRVSSLTAHTMTTRSEER